MDIDLIDLINPFSEVYATRTIFQSDTARAGAAKRRTTMREPRP